MLPTGLPQLIHLLRIQAQFILVSEQFGQGFISFTFTFLWRNGLIGQHLPRAASLKPSLILFTFAFQW